jgi:hypothetical protein
VDNIELVYLYRDGGNYKKWGRVVFSNPSQLTDSSIERELRNAFLEDGLFIANQIRVPEVFLYAGREISFDDHCYHEFSRVCPTTKNADDTHRRSIGNFISEVNRESQLGWQVFDPYDSEGSYGYLLSSRVL